MVRPHSKKKWHFNINVALIAMQINVWAIEWSYQSYCRAKYNSFWKISISNAVLPSSFTTTEI